VLGAFFASVALGTTDIALPAFYQALIHYDPTQVAHIIILTERLPRAVIATLVGASLAIAGADGNGKSMKRSARRASSGVLERFRTSP
jgi:iron complex transport system permease protein